MVGCSEHVPRPVFVDTNMGTRFAAVPASPEITAVDFKRELESTHLSCFPDFGAIKVTALMVKRKSRFYILSNSLPLKCAFLDSDRSWFLQMEAHPQSLSCSTTETHNPNIITSSDKPHDPTIRADKKRIKRTRKGKKGKCKTKASWTEKGNTTETLNESFSESVSVSRIIKTYFPDDSDEVASTPFSTVETRHEHKCCPNRRKLEVGKRLLLAQDNMRLTPGHLGASLLICRDRLEKSPFCESAALVRYLAFEITSEESE